MDPQHITAFAASAAFVLYVLDRVINLVKALRESGRGGSCEVAHAQQLACMERLVDAISTQTEILRELSAGQQILLERVPQRSYTPRAMETLRDLEELRRRNIESIKENSIPPGDGTRQGGNR